MFSQIQATCRQDSWAARHASWPTAHGRFPVLVIAPDSRKVLRPFQSYTLHTTRQSLRTRSAAPGESKAHERSKQARRALTYRSVASGPGLDRRGERVKPSREAPR